MAVEMADEMAGLWESSEAEKRVAQLDEKMAVLTVVSMAASMVAPMVAS
jgi:hypothetical protein